LVALNAIEAAVTAVTDKARSNLRGTSPSKNWKDETQAARLLEYPTVVDPKRTVRERVKPAPIGPGSLRLPLSPLFNLKLLSGADEDAYRHHPA
jgi:hypothetical protein